MSAPPRLGRWSLVLALSAVCGACGRSRVSPQLEAARAVTAKAREDSAHELETEAMRAARRLLARAEAQIDGSEAEEHFAYLAERRARVAISETRRTSLERAAASETPAASATAATATTATATTATATTATATPATATVTPAAETETSATASATVVPASATSANVDREGEATD